MRSSLAQREATPTAITTTCRHSTAEAAVGPRRQLRYGYGRMMFSKCAKNAAQIKLTLTMMTLMLTQRRWKCWEWWWWCCYGQNDDICGVVWGWLPTRLKICTYMLLLLLFDILFLPLSRLRADSGRQLVQTLKCTHPETICTQA